MAATEAQVTAAQEALGTMNLVGPMRRIFRDDQMADALEVLLAQEVEVVSRAVADAVVAAGPDEATTAAAPVVRHGRTGPGRCACGFDAYKFSGIMLDYAELLRSHLRRHR